MKWNGVQRERGAAGLGVQHVPSPLHSVMLGDYKNLGSDMGSSNPTLPLPSCVTLDELHDLSSKSLSVLSCKMGRLRGLNNTCTEGVLFQD